MTKKPVKISKMNITVDSDDKEELIALGEKIRRYLGENLSSNVLIDFFIIPPETMSMKINVGFEFKGGKGE